MALQREYFSRESITAQHFFSVVFFLRCCWSPSGHNPVEKTPAAIRPPLFPPSRLPLSRRPIAGLIDKYLLAKVIKVFVGQHPVVDLPEGGWTRRSTKKKFLSG